MTLSEWADIAQIVIALGTFGAFIAVVFSARRATEAAADSRRSAELAKALVEAERERIEVELKPVIDLYCYQTNDGSWVIKVTNRGPRDVDELTVTLAEYKAIRALNGVLRQGDVTPLAERNLEVRKANMRDGAYAATHGGGPIYTLRDLYRDQPQYLRVARTSGEPTEAWVTLDYRSGGRGWSEHRTVRLPRAAILSASQMIIRTPDGRPVGRLKL